MNKFRVSLAIVAVLAVLISAANVLASPNAATTLGKPSTLPAGSKPSETPGARATEAASRGDTPPAGNVSGKKTTYKGVVAGLGSGSLTLTLKDGSSQTFVVNSDTKINVPSLGREATLADIVVGVQALVQADSNLTALRVNIIPGKPATVHRVGTVTAYTAGSSITIQDKDGATFSFAIDANTKVLPQDRAAQLAVGSRVTIISRRDVTGGALTAEGIVVQSSNP